VPLGVKRPDWTGWETTTFEQTQKPDYQRRLYEAIRRGGNIGVLLGNGLVSVDADGDDEAQEFDGLNPEFSGTLQSKGFRGRQYWLQLTGQYPVDKAFYPLKSNDGKKWGEFRSNHCQTIVFGQHPNGTPENIIRYRILVAKPTMVRLFPDIAWPPNLLLPWLQPKPEPMPAGAPAPDLTADLDKRILAYIASIPPAIEHNGGDLQTFSVACKLVNGFALSAEQALSYLTLYNSRCKPPWSEKEIRHKLTEAEKAPHQKARGHLVGDTIKLKKKDVEVRPRDMGDDRQEPLIIWETSTNSTNLPGGNTQKGYVQRCIYPEDSILADYMEQGRTVCESADIFLLGAGLPMFGAMLARRIRFPYGAEVQFPNLFEMLTGQPATRKSSAINFAAQLAREVLPLEVFMPKRFSVETLFDEYDAQRNGSPDKLWVYGDAKPILTDWKKTSYGERVAAEVLDLYDCLGMTENYRRNATKKNPQTRRHIAQTSTSLVFGATPGDASFPGQSIQSGVARRFLFSLAEGKARELPDPPTVDIKPLAKIFARMCSFQGICTWAEDAQPIWNEFHHENSVLAGQIDSRREAEEHRLGSAAMQTLHVAMIFEACIRAKTGTPGFNTVSKAALLLAIDHVNAALDAAKYLDSIANRAVVLNDAEILLSKIRKDFWGLAKGGAITLTRSEITAKYAPHSSRQGSWNPDMLFLKMIPALARQGMAKLHEKTGKKEVYAFRCE
jgi:hypothetical protein